MTAPAAISRIDDGTAIDEDRRIADVFDVHCQWDATRFELRQVAYDAERCVICGGSCGPECAGCTAGWDKQIAESCDV